MPQKVQLLFSARDMTLVLIGLLLLGLGLAADVVAPGTWFSRMLQGQDSFAIYTCIVSIVLYIARHIHISLTAPAQARRLRETWFIISPEELKLQPTDEFPTVFCVVMDWPVPKVMTTVVALADGMTRVFTTRGLTIFGGRDTPEMRPVEAAAKSLVREAQAQLSRATAVSAHAQPEQDLVRFYVRTYGGLFMIEDRAKALMDGTSPFTSLFVAGNAVMTELFRASGLAQPRPADAAGQPLPKA